MGRMAKKKVPKGKESYSLEEVRILTDKYIDEAADRLRIRLREAWKKQAATERRTRHGITV